MNELWLISCYYNPYGYLSKKKNYELFINSIENAGLNYLVVECAFGDQPFNLPRSKNVLRAKAPDVLWQKERLLNLAVAKLPEKCKKVVWIDCDVLFENPDWAKETVRLLNDMAVVQPFKEAIRLPKDSLHYTGDGERYPGFAYAYTQNPEGVLGGRFEGHGHTGFAWATHRRLLKEYGLYDVCLSGNADHLMAHSFVGHWDSGCTHNLIGRNSAYYNHYANWSEKIYKDVKAKVNYVEGVLLHLWHGDTADRNYTGNQRALESFNFNPATDIVLTPNGCWKWNHNNIEFKKWAKEFFPLRKED